jgi:hypothetical protein
MNVPVAKPLQLPITLHTQPLPPALPCTVLTPDTPHPTPPHPTPPHPTPPHPTPPRRAYFRAKVKDTLSPTHYGSLRLHVRRAHVFEDSFYQLRMRSPDEMRAKLNVDFSGEGGMDAGGLTREWYQVCVCGWGGGIQCQWRMVDSTLKGSLVVDGAIDASSAAEGTMFSSHSWRANGCALHCGIAPPLPRAINPHSSLRCVELSFGAHVPSCSAHSRLLIP